MSPSYILAENLPQNKTFYRDQHVWVCKSKGLKKNHTKRRDLENESCEQRMELFLRAQVVEYEPCDKPESSPSNHLCRVRVRYPKGSTYACHPHRLIPVYTSSSPAPHTTIIVSPETSEYRRLCVVHTLQSFLEIGCDYGVTVHRVHTQGLIPHVWGMDKSIESIAIARQNYPNLPFYCFDVLAPTEDWPAEIQPEVVAIDINGNRELPAVQQCIQVVLERYQPRLIIVKSRALAQTL
ncbi:hypothetical protein FisN_9Lh072 [Fistulifera solaris]|uniref:Methyltransferase domain-containing protein n=1 Tax=Fistulifera solaris TaxID=1519565 RepID=A0A1Z5KKG6_FISSO|nr:hypothetical protein FisN_9Lh072 [Fistulifera solaris]|eukprot:GAX26803.1 hypothetical protein FisN_9Lh072 [Fistulifera solaris]